MCADYSEKFHTNPAGSGRRYRQDVANAADTDIARDEWIWCFEDV